MLAVLKLATVALSTIATLQPVVILEKISYTDSEVSNIYSTTEALSYKDQSLSELTGTWMVSSVGF